MFCQRCGAPLASRVVDHRPRPACDQCGFVLFEDPKVAVAAILIVPGGIVLCQRAIEPGIGKWSFPAGFVDRGEELSAALRREILEETGLSAEVNRLIGVYSSAGNPVVLVVYEARGDGELRGSAEALAVRSFDPAMLPELAFEHDARILSDWRADRQ